MKKLLYVFISIIGLAFLLLSYHSWEEKACNEWKIKLLSIGENADSKQRKYGWSEERKNQYIDSLINEMNNSEPVMCPYCYYKTLKYK